MNDPFDNIVKQAKAIANPEQTVSKMDALEAENKTLKRFVKRLTEAGNKMADDLGATGWDTQSHIEWQELLIAEWEDKI